MGREGYSAARRARQSVGLGLRAGLKVAERREAEVTRLDMKGSFPEAHSTAGSSRGDSPTLAGARYQFIIVS